MVSNPEDSTNTHSRIEANEHTSVKQVSNSPEMTEKEMNMETVNTTYVTEARQDHKSQSTAIKRNLLIVGIVALCSLLTIWSLFSWRHKDPAQLAEKSATNAHDHDEHGSGHVDEHGHSDSKEIALEPETLKAAGIEIEGVTQRPAIALLRVTGTVETNQQQTQQVTPLVGGRVERVNVSIGDRVRAGSVMAVIASPQIAQLHGKLHEAETHLALAERNLQRVQRSENRVAVLQAKAKLDEADATLKRVKRLIELGVGAGKDLIAAETAHKTAKAEYEFQSNISLNKELQEARAAVETSRVDVAHIRDEIRSLGAPVPVGEQHSHDRDTSLIALRTPASGTVTERLVNPGAGIEAGRPLFTISNLSTVWVIANVAESQIGQLRIGTPAEIRATGSQSISGRVDYIDPQLNEETRTARVRITVANPEERLKAGMFVEIGFQTNTATTEGEELVVSTEAVQQLGERSVVFLPKENELGHFEAREVELGGEVEGYRRVLSGLKLGDKVVTKGSFTLKTQMLKGEMGDHDH
jgi:membrane fusion protein, heavy metal efflux system